MSNSDKILLSFRIASLFCSIFSESNRLVTEQLDKSHYSYIISKRRGEKKGAKYLFFKQEINISLSTPYRDNCYFEYEGKKLSLGESLVIEVYNKDLEGFSDNQTIILHSTGGIFENKQILEDKYHPIISLVVLLYFKRYPNSESDLSLRHSCNLVFGAYHFPLSLLLNPGFKSSHLLTGKFDQIENDPPQYNQSHYGSIAIAIEKWNKELITILVGRKTDLLNEDSREIIKYKRTLQKLEENYFDTISNLRSELELSLIKSYSSLVFTLCNRYLAPVDLFPFISLREDNSLVKTSNIAEKNCLFFDRLIKIVEFAQNKDEDFWKKAQLVLYNSEKEHKEMVKIFENQDLIDDFVNDELSVFLGHLFRSIANLLPYCPDFSFQEKNLEDDDVYQDLYTNKCGDCEDFSLSIYRTINIFRKLQTGNRKILLLQKYLSNFIPFITKMIVNTSHNQNLPIKDMVLHTVCMLVPLSRFVIEKSDLGSSYSENNSDDNSFNLSKLHPILIDGTTRTRMVYRKIREKYNDKQNNKQIYKYFSLLRGLVIGCETQLSKRILHDNDNFFSELYLKVIQNKEANEEDFCDLIEKENKNQTFIRGGYLSGGNPFYKYVLSLQTTYYYESATFNNHLSSETNYGKRKHQQTVPISFIPVDSSENKYPIIFEDFMECSSNNGTLHFKQPNLYIKNDVIKLSKYFNIERKMDFPLLYEKQQIKVNEMFVKSHKETSDKPNNSGDSINHFIFELNITDLPKSVSERYLKMLLFYFENQKNVCKLVSINNMIYARLNKTKIRSIIFKFDLQV